MCGSVEREKENCGVKLLQSGRSFDIEFHFTASAEMLPHFPYGFAFYVQYTCVCDCDVICREWVELKIVKQKKSKSWGWKFFLLHQLSVQLTSMRNSISKEFPCCQLIKLPFSAVFHSLAVGVNYFRLCNSVRCTWEFLSLKIWFDTQTYTWDVNDMNMWMWVNESSETPK